MIKSAFFRFFFYFST
ncbi:pheST operon leader peptide PheM [Xenorhabdus griffiniae]|nr:pheST operon leader peptide PheM [Xenorhabdus griffiniae]MBE8588180.1 pheST operon leader peptide PheM [Xenorhabdus griffiniae]